MKYQFWIPWKITILTRYLIIVQSNLSNNKKYAAMQTMELCKMKINQCLNDSHQDILWSKIILCKVHILLEGHKNWRNLHLFWQNICFYSVVSKQLGDFFKILWSFQKSRTLIRLFKLIWMHLIQSLCCLLSHTYHKQTHRKLKSTLLNKSRHFLSNSVNTRCFSWITEILNIGNLYAFENMGWLFMFKWKRKENLFIHMLNWYCGKNAHCEWTIRI